MFAALALLTLDVNPFYFLASILVNSGLTLFIVQAKSS